LHVTFFGTSEFAVPALRRIREAGHDIDPVVTSAAKPSGRGRRLTPGPVESAARELGLNVAMPASPNAADFLDRLRENKPEVGVLTAYGFILGRKLLQVPSRGFLNIHPSLLPRYRGAAPIQRAVMNGEVETGVTVIRMSEEVDAGDVLLQQRVAIGLDQTAGELSDVLALLGAEMILKSLSARPWVATAQDPTAATPAPKVGKFERLVDWTLPASQVHNRIRALSPEPGAVALFRGQRVVLLRTTLSNLVSPSPGAILAGQAGLLVGAGDNAIEVLQLKPEGRKVQTGRDFQNGRRIATGERMTTN
jgi:methionyl-tRNA formyltransferase